MTRHLAFLGIVFYSAQLSAQRIDDLSSLFNVRDSNYVRISYDNDVFVGNDKYYTQGISLELFSDVLQKSPINKLLANYRNSAQNRYGIQFFSSAYTPTTILSDSVLIGDRPFSAVLGVRFAEVSINPTKPIRLSSTLDLGIIGSYAFGKEIQSGIHTLIGNELPRGWENQIKNAPIVNYSVRLERELYSYSSLLSIQGMSRLHLGTFQSNLAAGLELSIGSKNNIYEKPKHRFEFFLYSQSMLKVIAYDARLMGGIINRDAYYLSYNQIAPVVAEQHLGIVFTSPHCYIGFDVGIISREIKAGQTHSWGGIRLGFY